MWKVKTVTRLAAFLPHASQARRRDPCSRSSPCSSSRSGLAVRGSFSDAGDDLRNADPALFALGCGALAAVLPRVRLRLDAHPRRLGQSASRIRRRCAPRWSRCSRSNVPGGVWTPAARVVAVRRAGRHRRCARHGVDPRRGGHLRCRGCRRLRRVPRVGEGRRTLRLHRSSCLLRSS